MDIWNENTHVFNIRLAKLTGLFQILNPASITFLGRNVYHIVMAIIMLYMSFISMIMIVSMYYWANSILVSTDYGWKGITTLFLVYKMWRVICHSNDIWNCLTITRYDFTSVSLHHRHILEHWRKLSVWITNTITVAYLTSLVFFMGGALVFHDDILTVKNQNGSISNYRQNFLNLHLIVTDETYNAHYKTFYFIETLALFCMSILFLVFDILLVTLWLAVSCQIQMFDAAFESVGNKPFSAPHDTPIIDNAYDKKKISNKHNLIYDELISIIMDHQAVIKKYYELNTIFKQLMLWQVFYSSISLIVIWFRLIKSFTSEDRFFHLDVTTVKIIFSIPSITFQLFLACSLFDNIHEQKDSIIYALYSSNWTEMNMKCKKLILLTMKMNNANQKKLKFTRTKIINKELFCIIIRNCYSVVWVLINYIKVSYE